MWSEHMKAREAGLALGEGGFDLGRPSLLCVHGSGGRGEEFAPLLTALGQAANCAALDLPGHGHTPGAGRRSVDDYAAWVADFLEAGPVRPVLLGHSLGGAIALTVALTRPELLSGLVLWGSGGRLRVLPAILEGLARGDAAVLDMLLDLAYAPGTPAKLKDIGRALWRVTPSQVTWGDYYACDHFDLMDRLNQVALPTLVVCGEQDRLTPPKYSQYLAARIPGAELAIVAGAGHMLHQEQPQAAARPLAAFLARF